MGVLVKRQSLLVYQGGSVAGTGASAGVKSPYPRVKHTSVLLLPLPESVRHVERLNSQKAMQNVVIYGLVKGLCGRCLSV